ncbi:MAG: protein-disulfide reductase DsbD domain-containing protein [Pseudomonadota bacterium]|nr:protein-disulfide reductase DsbD domain-containing protein [Pseudomonadota bacterium]
MKSVLDVFISAFFASLLAIFPALAGMTTPWIKGDVIEARLVLARDAEQHFAGIEIVMQPGWHTYWRYPGASGIVPSFDFSASQNLKTQDPVFPAPYFFDDGAGGFFGYEGLTGFVVPFLLENASEGGQVNLNLELGVCREVCLPVQFSFDLPLKPGPLKTPDELDIIQAMLDAGPVAPSAELAIDALSYDGAALKFVVVGTNLENPQIMAIPGPNDVFGMPHISERRPSSFLIEMPAWSVLDQTMIGRIVEVIVRDGERAVFQKIQIGDHRVSGK